MNKGQLIDAVGQQVGLSKKDSKAAVDAVLETIMKSVKKESVQIAGFGSFIKTKRKARNARNPQTGETIKVKASTSVRFKPAKAFKDVFGSKK